MSAEARTLVERFERSLPASTRRDRGVHYTPPALARLVVELAMERVEDLPRTVCDPACGAGSFLLAAADALRDRGVPVREIVEHRLVGVELDPGAVAVAREALALWAGRHGEPDVAIGGITVADALELAPVAWPGRPTRGFDVVVGNPPFLGQLDRRTARDAVARNAARDRVGDAVRYADTSALFLLGAVDLVRPGGVVAMLQPQSFLAATDSAAIRDRLVERSVPVALWASDEKLFDAEVRVCAPVLVAGRRSHGRSGSPAVRLRWGSAGDDLGSVPLPPPGAPWGTLLAPAHGIPGLPAVCGAGAPLSQLAAATAGFRDEYYALRDAMVDPAPGPPDEWPPLVTVGMIDPGVCGWGARPTRFGGERRLAPALDVAGLADRSPRVSRWVEARRVPKVVVATQTRVVEAAVDPAGAWVPVTPLISVEPRLADDVWAIAAALLSPPVSAGAVARHLGSGLSPGALRWSAAAVLEVPLPTVEDRWNDGTELVHRLVEAPAGERDELLAQLGSVMCQAYGLDPDHEVHGWWRGLAVRR